MDEIEMRVNGHSIVAEEIEGHLSYRCDECNMHFLTEESMRERRQCPVETPALPE